LKSLGPSSKESSVVIQNRLLASLTRDEYERLLPNLELIQLPKHRILHEAGDPIHHAYFLNSGVASLLAVTKNGETIEIGTVGNEGFIRGSIIPKQARRLTGVMTQTSAEALRVNTSSLLTEFNRGGKLHEALLLYSRVLETAIVPAAVGNLFNTVKQRFARCQRSAGLQAGCCLERSLGYRNGDANARASLITWQSRSQAKPI
jgi:CRP-like cAMP-binding protein